MFTRLYLAFTILLLIIPSCFAQSPGRDTAREKVITDQLESIAPSAVADFKTATTAMDSGNYAEAVRLYEAVRMKAPAFDPVLRRLGTSLVLQGKVGAGLDLLEQAVAKNRSPENLISLAGYLANPGEGKQGTKEQRWRAYSLALEADQKHTNNDADYQILLAQLAGEFNQNDIYRRATEKLVATHPELMVTHYFSAHLAAYDGHWITAENEIKKAESMGLPHAAAQEFLDSGVHAQASIWRYSIYSSILV